MPADPHSLYRDPRRYDLLASLLYSNLGDLAFYQRQCRRFPGPVLELACGTGRLTVPLAASGIDISGLDLSAPMLALARSKARRAGAHVAWLRADLRRFQLERSFAIIFLPLNSLCHLHSLRDLDAFFARVRAHLQPHGRFIVDVFNPSLEILNRDPDQTFPFLEFDHPDNGGRVIVTESSSYDTASQVNRVRWSFHAEHQPVDHVVIDARVFFPQEFDALLRYHGLAVEQKFGTYYEGPFQSNSPRQLAVCRLAA